MTDGPAVGGDQLGELSPPPHQEFTALELWIIGYAIGLARRHGNQIEDYGPVQRSLHDLEDRVERLRNDRSEWELAAAARRQPDIDNPF